jgi:hypothetical protein
MGHGPIKIITAELVEEAARVNTSESGIALMSEVNTLNTYVERSMAVIV